MVKMNEIKVDFDKLKEAFLGNEVVTHNLGSIVSDFEMMHSQVSFDGTNTGEEMELIKQQQIGTFICGVLSASSPDSQFRKNLNLPDSHVAVKEDKAKKFASNLSV